MRPKEIGLIVGGKAIGRAVKEISEVIPVSENQRRLIRAGTGILGLIVSAVDKIRVPEDAKVVSAVMGADLLVDEVVDFIFEQISKPKAAGLTVPAIQITPKKEEVKGKFF